MFITEETMKKRKDCFEILAEKNKVLEKLFISTFN
jgi:hypothetical protein